MDYNLSIFYQINTDTVFRNLRLEKILHTFYVWGKTGKKFEDAMAKGLCQHIKICIKAHRVIG